MAIINKNKLIESVRRRYQLNVDYGKSKTVLILTNLYKFKTMQHLSKIIFNVTLIVKQFWLLDLVPYSTNNRCLQQSGTQTKTPGI